jgi:hypothetical protein
VRNDWKNLPRACIWMMGNVLFSSGFCVFLPLEYRANAWNFGAVKYAANSWNFGALKSPFPPTGKKKIPIS